jgi:hypothetical protein
MSTSITISKQIAIQDEGVLKTSDVNSIDFTGAGITATNVGNAVTVNVPGSAGGGGVHVLTTPISNRTYSVRLNAVSFLTYASIAGNNILLYPFIPANSLTIKNLIVNVQLATVGGLLRLLVYSDLNGVPSSKLLESTSLDCSTTGDKTYTAAFTFTAGTTYWLGTYSNLSVSLIILDYNEMIPISNSGMGSAFSNVNVATTFPNAPATLGTTNLSQSYAPSINLTAV